MGFDPAVSVRARLERVLAEGTLPPAARDHGEKLLRRFGKPVRVAILGLPGSGKTQLLNMLLGRHLIADGRALPVTEVVAGPAWRTRIARGDAPARSFDGSVLEGPELAGATMLTLEAPLAILERISLLEVAADASVESQRQAVAFAASRAEILVWCTQGFSDLESLLWRRVPEATKDHAYLAVTKADELQRAGVLSQLLAAMNAALAEEFCGIFPVATLRALAALGDGRAEQEAFAASGGRALRNAVLKHVEQGRRADLDSALLFLRRFEAVAGGAEAAGTPATATAQATACDADAATGSGERRAFLDEALGHLRKRSEILATLAPEAGKDKFATFLSACAETADGLGERLAAHGASAASAELHETISEASEMLLLLRLEKGAGPAADAATLLLQLRRELEDELAG